jgi:uncharacterized membrane protein
MQKGYDLIGLYHDRDDRRVIVPKRVRALGWTVNVGHRKGKLVLSGIGLAIVAAAVLQYG